MYMNDIANLILILSCIHVHVGIYMLFWVCLLLLFCWPLGSGVAFYSLGFGQHDILTLYNKPNQIFWGDSQLLLPHSVHVLL